MQDISTLQEIEDLRRIWPLEAVDFTPWLAKDDHISLLADALGTDIEIDETESAVGGFHADILAHEIGTEKTIIIENQLEDTNHDHLGKLITYAAGKSADIIVWVVKHARQEHQAAIEWLNNHTDEDIGFFLCEIKLYQIDNSRPAVKFEVIEQPNDWAKRFKTPQLTNPAQQQYYAFWEDFQAYAFQNDQFVREFHRRKVSAKNWLDYPIGSTQAHLTITQIPAKKKLEVGLYICDNKDLFHQLHARKDEIEAAADIKYNWQELPHRKASRITISSQVDFENSANRTQNFDWLVNTLLATKRAFIPYLIDNLIGLPSKSRF